MILPSIEPLDTVVELVEELSLGVAVVNFSEILPTSQPDLGGVLKGSRLLPMKAKWAQKNQQDRIQGAETLRARQ